MIKLEDFEIKETPSGIKYIEINNIEEVLGKEYYEKFGKWMTGQTAIIEGIYPCDVSNFLHLINTGKEAFWD